MADKTARVARWFELHGPGLRAQGISWRFDFDTDVYTFARTTQRTGEALAVADTAYAQRILDELFAE